ncbi:MAG: HAD family phosphatase [Planctomycetes bacterium]|nr:HAD family phosphatase [Planctomycetota bacterium]
MRKTVTTEIEALIFDCDGTLCDSMPAHYAAWAKVLEPVGMTLDRDRYLSFSGTPSQRVIPLLAEEQGITLPDFPSLNRAKEDSFLDVAHLLQPIEPVVKIARENRGRLPMAVASGGVRRLVMRQLEQLQILDWFDTVVTAEDTERHKPDPDVFLEAARRLGVAPEKCRVYEDGAPGIEAAHRAGMECIDIRPWL